MLILGDCVEKLRELETNSIDAVVTSPPYDNLRAYGGTCWDFEETAKELCRVLRPGGCIIWIVADSITDGSKSGSSFRQCLFFQSLGLNAHDIMIWNKGANPYQHKKRYINAFDYMFILSKGSPNTANLIKDRRNKWAGTRVHGTETQRSGIRKPLSEIQKSKVIKEFGARLNIWDFPPEKNNKTGHPAVFPVSLAEDHIKTWTAMGDIVLDPFMGSGTTGIAAKNLERRFIGIEINPSYFEISKNRIENHNAPI